MKEKTFEERFAHYRYPDGSWNWQAMTLEDYREIDARDKASASVSIGTGWPTEYTESARKRLHDELESVNNDERKITPHIAARMFRRQFPSTNPLTKRTTIYGRSKTGRKTIR